MNILYIFADQMCHDALSCMGNPYVKTPELDKLAARGVVFEQATCAQPLCTPSRATMISGVMPHNHGVTTNRSDTFAPDFVEGIKSGRWSSMGKLFHEGGYRTGYFGKWHTPIPQDDQATHGFDRLMHIRDHQITRCFSQWLDESEDEFFGVLSFNNPHNICEFANGTPLPDADLPSLPSLAECPPLPENFEIPDEEPGWIREFQRRRAAFYIAPGYDKDQWRIYLWAYYRLCEAMDAQVGRVMAALRVQGVVENTLIVFASDHGEGLASHRWAQKQVFYERSIRVPFFVCPPENVGKFQGRRESQLVNAGLDILPTLLAYAGIDAPECLEGRELRSAVEGVSTSAPLFVVCETDFTGGQESYGAGGRMIRTDRYKYVVYTPHEMSDIHEQFFDLKEDPGEMKNLINCPSMQETIEEHRAHLQGWQEIHHDNWNAV